jgi:hypothetical protein
VLVFALALASMCWVLSAWAWVDVEVEVEVEEVLAFTAPAAAGLVLAAGVVLPMETCLAGVAADGDDAGGVAGGVAGVVAGVVECAVVVLAVAALELATGLAADAAGAGAATGDVLLAALAMCWPTAGALLWVAGSLAALPPEVLAKVLADVLADVLAATTGVGVVGVEAASVMPAKVLRVKAVMMILFMLSP